jgi:hypothetical protein
MAQQWLCRYSKPSLIRINWEGQVIRINEAKDGPIRQKTYRTKNGKFNSIGSAVENKLKICHCRNFSLCQKLKSRVSFIKLKPILDIFAWFQSLQLSWTQSESPLALIPRAHTRSLLKYVRNCEQNFSFLIFWFGLSDIRINCNRISEDLL